MMTLRVLAVLTILGATAAAQDQPATTNRRKIETPKPTKAQAITIPKDAVQIDPNTYRYTDPSGKKWIYSKTPFGTSRVEDKGVSAEDAKKAQEETAHQIESTKAVEDGDSIRFERASPFGITRWQRKKGELNEVERAVWDRELEKRTAPQGAANASAATASKD
jgi:glucose/arabinose dehydrogenase